MSPSMVTGAMGASVLGPDHHLDLSSCEAEPIRFPGAVQPHGALLVLHETSWRIEAASESCQTLLGQTPESLLGQHIAQLLGQELAHTLLTPSSDTLWPLLSVALGQQKLSARAHRNSGGQLLIDFEPIGTDAASGDFQQRCRQHLGALRGLTDMDSIATQLVKGVRAITGFDRVMLYRFDADWNGQVLAEARAEHIEPYLGLHFPASDIPKQARELFKSGRVRQISDALYTPSALVALGHAQQIDLGRSSLRSVSPLHIEYMKNMQVRSSLVGSLIVDGALWGLLSCQNKTLPQYFDAMACDALGWLCEDVASLIEGRLIRQRRERELDLALRRRRLAERIRAFDFKTLMQRAASSELLGVVNADSFALQIGGLIEATQGAPSTEQILEIQRRRLARDGDSALFSSNALKQDLAIEALDGDTAGVLCVSLPARPDVTLMWFRQERARVVVWGGGNAEQAHSADEQGRISPRKSFAQFMTTIVGKSLPWTPEELNSAAELVSLIEIELLREREAFAQAILNSMPAHIAVLDHQGHISAVNAAWRNFAKSNGVPDLAEGLIGRSYLDENAAANAPPDVQQQSATMRGAIAAVLNHDSNHFSFDYPCNSPEEERWFRMSAVPLLGIAKGAVIAHENITVRKLETIQLAQLLDEHQAILGSDLVGFVKIQHKRIQWTNKAFNTMLGFEEGALNGCTTRQCFADDDSYAVCAREAYQAVQSGGAFRTTLQLRRKDGQLGWYALHYGMLRPQGDTFIGVLIDLSDQIRAEMEQRELLVRLQQIASRVPGMVYKYQQQADGRDRFIYASDAMRDIYRLSPDEVHLDASKVFQRIHPQDRQGFVASVQESASQLSAWVHEYRLRFEDGTERWLLGNAMPQQEQDGSVVWHGFTSDITERKRVEEELAIHRADVQLGVSRQRLRELVVQNESVREQERKAMAREIHDELGQVLTGLRMRLLLMEMRYCALDPALPSLVADMKDLLDRGIRGVRDVVLYLRPNTLDLGLVHAIETLCAESASAGAIAFALDLPGGDCGLDEMRAVVVYRIVQESITNALRHGSASRIRISLRSGDALVLEVTDNGTGFDVAAGQRKNSFGLLGMNERAIALGGTLEIESQLQYGSTIRLTIPHDFPGKAHTP